MRGLTLVELLVVLVLSSLLMTLIAQGISFTLLNLDRVTRYQREATRELLEFHWFTTSASAIVAHTSPERRFTGTEDGFTALTLEPLAAASGLPTLVRWQLRPSLTGTGMDILYSEGREVNWLVKSLPFATARFEYLSRERGWLGSWAGRDERGEYIPQQLRLTRGDREEVYWLVHLPNFHQPVIDYRNE